MAVEKMKMLTVSGKMTELDAFIDRCCLDGRIQVEQAAAYITDTMGYVPLTEPNVYADRLAAVRELAASFGRKLHYREDVRGSQDDAQVDSEQLAGYQRPAAGAAAAARGTAEAGQPGAYRRR